MWSPSGAQVASPSLAGLAVTCRGLEPSAFITHTSGFPERRLVNSSFDPSGDQSGRERSSAALFAVRFVCAAPVADIDQMSKLPERSLSNAIVVPSGDHDAVSSRPGSVVSRVTPL